MNQANSSFQNQAQSNDDEQFDLKIYLYKFIHFWPWLIVSLFIGVVIAFLFNRYAEPRYSLNTTLLIKSAANSRAAMGGMDAFMGSSLLTGSQGNLENEIGILRSYTLTRKTLAKLDFGVTIKSLGLIKNSEAYGKTPFEVIVDSSHLQLSNATFMVDIEGGGKFKLYATIEGAELIDPITQNVLQQNVTLQIEPTAYLFGQKITNPYFSFTIEKGREQRNSIPLPLPNNQAENNKKDNSGKNSKYELLFNSLEGLTKKYFGRVA